MSTKDAAPEHGGREELESEIVERIRRMIAAAVLFSHQVADKLKLGPSDSQFMTLLDVHGPLTAGRLAELTGLRTGTVTGVLDRLENAGFVRRERDPHDRRKVIVTPVAGAVEERLSPHYAGPAGTMSGVLAQYDEDQLALIAGFLRTAGSASFPTAARPGD